MWYPSLCNKGYPYSHWSFKHEFAVYETLRTLGEAYHGIYRLLRYMYKWPPVVVDEIEISRLMRIHKECTEEIEEKRKRAGTISEIEEED